MGAYVFKRVLGEETLLNDKTLLPCISFSTREIDRMDLLVVIPFYESFLPL